MTDPFINVTLKAGGDRVAVTPEEAREIQSRFEACIKLHKGGTVRVTKLDLSCRVWNPVVLEELRPFLQEYVAPTLEILQIDDIIASLMTDDGLATITFFADVFKNSPLKAIYIHNNALGTRAIEILKPLLQAPTLEELDLSNCGIAEADGKTLKEILTQPTTPSSDSSTASNLKYVNFGRNQMGPGGATHVAEILKKASNLKTFINAGTRALTVGTDTLCAGLAEGTAMAGSATKLRYLDFDDCNFGEQGLESLCTILEKSPLLQHLILTGTDIHNEGLESIVKALAVSGAQLVCLVVGGNDEIDEEGCGVLNRYLCQNAKDSLKTLVLEGNFVGDQGIWALTEFFQCCELECLNLESNEIGPDGARALLTAPIESLKMLVLTDNMDITPSLGRQLQSMYEDKVSLDEDLDGEDEAEDVDSLANAMGGAHSCLRKRNINIYGELARA